MRPLIIDFETRSEIDLTKRGVTVYVRHPSTQVICTGYQIDGQTFVTPGARMAERIRDALADPTVVLVAHNALFERAIWTHVLRWPEQDPSRWYCTSNIAGLYNLPQSLGALTEYLWPKNADAQKDKRGKQLINLLSKPDRKTGEFNEDPDLLREMYEYCAQDVKVTARLFELLPAVPPGERRIQIADIVANERGYEVDRAFCTAAADIDSSLQRQVVLDCERLTGLRPTQTAKLRAWLADNGCDLPDMSRQTIESRLASLDDGIIKRVVELRIAGARGSTQKFQSLLTFSLPEFPRITHHTKYAAGNTARWIARGAQIHNFRSRNLISYDLPGIKKEVMTNTLPTNVDIRNYVGGAVRAAIIAAPGRHLALGDYSGMENRMLMYLSGETRQLDLIRKGLDVYRDLATRVFGIPDPAKIDPWQRQICKHMVLGLGFGMGALAFFVNLKFKFQVDLTYGICEAIVGADLDARTDEYLERLKANKLYRRHVQDTVCLDRLPLTRKIITGLVTTAYLVRLFRSDFADMSNTQSLIETSFTELMGSRPGASVDIPRAGLMERRRHAIVFHLPSGRPMYYWRPRLRPTKDKITGEWTQELVYDQATGGRMKTLNGYGARFLANFVQGISRDIMAEAFADLSESYAYDPVVTVHDEIISETDNDDPRDYEQAILDSAKAREWVRPIPLKVDADISPCWLSKG